MELLVVSAATASRLRCVANVSQFSHCVHQVPYFDLVLVSRAKPGFPSHWGKVPNFLGSIPNFSGILPTARLPQTFKKTQPGNGLG